MTEVSAGVSEYEAKRLRRIAENRQKLQALNIPTLVDPPSPKLKHKKRKREGEEKPLGPTRKSSRQRKKRKLEKQQRKLEKHERKRVDKKERKRLRKLEKKELKRLKKEKKLEKRLKKELNAAGEEKNEDKQKLVDNELEKRESSSEEMQQQEQQPRILDWRLRRKLQAREERRQATMKRREERRALRMKDKLKEKKLQLRERKLRKKQKEKEKIARNVQKELEKQRRLEENELMREEDQLARRLAKEEARQQAKDARKKKLGEKYAVWNQLVGEIMTDREKIAREKDEARNREIYPVRQINLPLVRISNAMETDKTKPLVLSPLLKVDANLFHAFSLGKQFLPPGKKSVMQGLCPGGFATEFQNDVHVHVWKNATTLFVSGTTGMFYHYMFEETTLRGRKYVFFRWSRCQDVTPPILWRLSQVQKGEELLRLDKSYYDTPKSEKPEPLLLFVQYPKGPYIYCGRLGYLGHKSNPLEFSFQLLDINALNWRHIRTLLTSC